MFSIICVYNKPEILEDCLKKSLNGQDVQYELISMDNTQGRFTSAADALNCGADKAKDEYIMFIHQDVSFSSDWLSGVLDQISHVEKTSKQWGVMGLMGVRAKGGFSGHIIDLHGHLYNPPLPCEVASLDEVCLIIRKDSGLRFDESLGGFHLYGTDLCLQANVKGLTNFAIDACLHHHGQGNKDLAFWNTAERLCAKWRSRHCPVSAIETTCGVFRLQPGLRAFIEYRKIYMARWFRAHINLWFGRIGKKSAK